MIIPIRPYQLFALIDRPANDRAISVQVPHRRGVGGLTLLETFVLLAAAQIVDARRVFEFGTYFGSTTLNLANNAPEGAEVFTLDLPFANAAQDQHPADAELTSAHFSEDRLDFEGAASEARIRRVTGNSRTMDFSPWKRKMDLVFIDGGHDLETVTSDTMSAFELVSSTGPAVIVWHDYKNADYPELSTLLDQQSEEREIFHVGDTMLCIWFNEKVAAAQRMGARETQKAHAK